VVRTSYETRLFLARTTSYRWLESGRRARRLLASSSADHELPLVFLPDGVVSAAPNRVNHRALGLRTTAESTLCLVVVGAGPSRLAAPYGAREDATAVIERRAWRQAAQSARISCRLRTV
jgi:hypothetical protein